LVRVEAALLFLRVGADYFSSSKVTGSSLSLLAGLGGRITFFLITLAS
jgi:hypothetical protein